MSDQTLKATVMLEATVVAIGTVLHLERHAWSMANWLKQAAKAYAPPCFARSTRRRPGLITSDPPAAPTPLYCGPPASCAPHDKLLLCEGWYPIPRPALRASALLALATSVVKVFTLSTRTPCSAVVLL